MEETVSKMLEVVRELAPGARTSTVSLALKAGVGINEIDAFDEFELGSAFREACYRAGIFLDDEGGSDAFACHSEGFVVRPILNPSPTSIDLEGISSLIFVEHVFPCGRKAIRLVRDDEGFASEVELGVAGQTLAPASKRLGSRFAAVVSKGFIESGVCGWEREYAAPEIMDGECWELLIILCDGRVIASGGCNAYPVGFEALTRALSRVGKAAFR